MLRAAGCFTTRAKQWYRGTVADPADSPDGAAGRARVALSQAYRDVEWIKATWYGNDWITLIVIVPLMLFAEAFKVVAALDLCLLVPGLASGGILLWRRRGWGYVIASIAAIQGSLYLVVLSVNSAIAIHRGLIGTPGELPLWGALAILTTSAAVVLMTSASGAATAAQPPADQRKRRTCYGSI